MSSSMNNSLPVQGLTLPTNSSDYTPQRQSPSLSSIASNTQRFSSERPRTTRRDRHGKSQRGGARFADSGRGRETVNTLDSDLPGESAPKNDGEVNSTNQGRGNTGRVIGYAPKSRGGSAKVRNRLQSDQLLDATTSLAGSDFDVIDNLNSSGSAHRTTNTGRGRHNNNSRKMNLTHLINYKSERRQRNDRFRTSSPYSDGGHVSHHRRENSHYRDQGLAHKFSKQQFLQANCQFVVLKGHDYTIHKADPDWPVDWNCIEEVRFKQSASTATTCPICLEPPVAAKITRCGHIYCWTCMLHYLSLSDENCRQCPICFEPVYRSDLRSVISRSFNNYSPGDTITMRLMIRKKGCVEVEPYNVEHQGNGQHLAPNDHHYESQANLVIIDAQTVKNNIIQRENEELSIKMALDKSEPEVCFVEQALDCLERRLEKLTSAPDCSNLDRQQASYASIDITDASKTYLFYQCKDNQHIYLSPFCSKILCQEYGSLENCPPEFDAKILQMNWISMNESWRKRFKYLEHLPLTCEFRLIEIDFKGSSLISEETYLLFQEQIERREQERERRRKEERKREKIIRVEQNRRIYGIQPSLKINLDNTDQFPSVSDERYLGLSQAGHQSRIDDYSSSSDDEHDVSSPSGPTNLQAYHSEQPEASLPDIASASAAMTLSFKDIQLQEEAKEAKISAANNNRSSNAWSSKKQGSYGDKSSSNAPQSSFAQLLVNAKTSQKQWTRNVSSKSGTMQTGSSSQQAAGAVRNRTTSVDSDDAGEELRAPPPSEFSISDFIEMNLVTSSSSKRKGVKSKRGR